MNNFEGYTLEQLGEELSEWGWAAAVEQDPEAKYQYQRVERDIKEEIRDRTCEEEQDDD